MNLKGSSVFLIFIFPYIFATTLESIMETVNLLQQEREMDQQRIREIEAISQDTNEEVIIAREEVRALTKVNSVEHSDFPDVCTHYERSKYRLIDQ